MATIFDPFSGGLISSPDKTQITAETVTANSFAYTSTDYGGVTFTEYNGTSYAVNDVLNVGYPIKNFWWGDYNSTLDAYLAFDHVATSINIAGSVGSNQTVGWETAPLGLEFTDNSNLKSRLQWMLSFEETSVETANTDGNRESYISKNNNGIHAITWTGDGSYTTQSVGHGLGVKPLLIVYDYFNNSSAWTLALPGLRGDDFTYKNGGNPTNDPGYMNSVDDTTFSLGTQYDAGDQFMAIAIAEVPGRTVSSFQNGNGSGTINIDFGFKPAFVLAKSAGLLSNTVDGMSTFVAGRLLALATSDNNVGYVNYYSLLTDQNTVTSSLVQITSTGLALEPGAPGNNSTQEGGGYYFIAFKGVPETVQPTILNSNSEIDDLTDVDTTTTAPTDGQALVWNNTNSAWEPGDRVESNTTTGGTGSSSVSNIVKISQVDYDALSTPDANTVYFIV